MNDAEPDQSKTPQEVGSPNAVRGSAHGAASGDSSREAEPADTVDDLAREAVANVGGSGREEAIAVCRGELGGILTTIGIAGDGALLALDLTLAQMRCLVVLGRQKAQPVGQVAARLNVSEPTASQLVERLVQRGLAERAADPSDRRRTLVSLSDEAWGMLEAVGDERERAVQQALARLDDMELQALSTGLRALATACSVPTSDADAEADQAERG